MLRKIEFDCRNFYFLQTLKAEDIEESGVYKKMVYSAIVFKGLKLKRNNSHNFKIDNFGILSSFQELLLCCQ